jgi:hypothetical protein
MLTLAGLIGFGLPRLAVALLRLVLALRLMLSVLGCCGTLLSVRLGYGLLRALLRLRMLVSVSGFLIR